MQQRLAANVLRVVAREYELAPAHLADERDALWRLLGKKGRPPASADLYQLVRDLNTELCERIEAGDGDQEPLKAKLLAYLRHDINARLAIDNPRFRR